MSVTQTARPNPYVGPRSFRTGETLYGRDREVQELLDLLIAERIVLLYSPSGAGKTSLVEAALIPYLAQEDFHILPPMRVNSELPPDLARNDRRPNRFIFSLLQSLEENLPPDQQTPLDRLGEMSLADYLQHRPRPDRAPQSDVLIFDQFEEIVTIDPTNLDDRIDFFMQVGEVLRDKNRWALFSMREDFLAALDPYLRQLPTRLANTFRLDLLGPAAALAAMQAPARTAGVDFSDPAASKLVDDLSRVRVQRPDGSIDERPGPHVEPVQLQVVCYRLWERLSPEARRIEVADVEGVGDVDTVLAVYYADRVATTARTSGVSERAIRDWVEQKLITEQGIRGQVLWGGEKTDGLADRAIRPLIEAHLVRAEKRRGAVWFELSHDRLINPIRADNARWREANLNELQRRAELWDKQNRPDELLLRDQALADAETWAEQYATELILAEYDFLIESRAARARVQRERRMNQLIRGLAVVATIVSIIAIYFFFQARDQARISTAREFAAAAIGNLDVDPERSILLALQAVAETRSVDNSVLPEAEDALHRALHASRLVHTIAGHTDEVYDVAFRPDGTRLATASADGTVKVWDATQGAELLTLSGHTNYVYSVAYSGDGARLVTGSEDGTAKVWNANIGEEVLTLSGHVDAVRDAAFSPDGLLIATASVDGAAKVWSASTGELLRTLAGHGDGVEGVVFSPDSERLATASRDGTAKVWDVATGTELLTLSGHTDWVYAIAFSPDGTRLVTASADRTAKVWDASTGQELTTLYGHVHLVIGIAYSPDGTRIATAAGDLTVKVWDAATGRELMTLPGHNDWVYGVAFSPDGKHLATASGDKTARIWAVSIEGDRELFTLAAHQERAYTVAYSPDGKRIATGGRDPIGKVWDAATGDLLFTLDGHAAGIEGVAFSPECDRPPNATAEQCESRIATASRDNTAKVWDAQTGQAVLTLTGHSDYVYDVAFSPNGTLIATGSRDATAKVWDAASGEERLTLQGHDDLINSVAFSPDGQRLVTASADGSAKVWDVNTGQEVLSLNGHTATVQYAVFSPECDSPPDAPAERCGKHIVTASEDGTAIIWDAVTGQAVKTLPGHIGGLFSVKYNRDGTRLVTGGADRTIKIWDAASGAELLTLTGHTDRVYSVAFSPECVSPPAAPAKWCGTQLASASADSTVRMYVLPIDRLIDLARQRVTRGFTPEECHKYLHRSDCPGVP